MMVVRKSFLRKFAAGFFFLLIFGSVGVFSQSTAASARGLTVIAQDKRGAAGEVKIYDNLYALVVGIDEFQNLPQSQQLSYAVKDAQGVKATLEKYYDFKRVDALFNKQASRQGIYEKLLDINRSLGPNDGLFVFIASHGTTVGDVGYIIPHDGSFDPSEQYKNISMVDLKDVLGKQIKAKHIFYAIDACYSGAILEKRGGVEASARDLDYLKEITREPVRYALTAGDAGQEVLDGGPRGHSVFTGRFIEALENAQDFITASGLSEDITRKVYSDAKDRGHLQTPKHGSLSGLGNFVFLKKSAGSLAEVEADLSALQTELAALRNQLSTARTVEDQNRIELEVKKKQAEEEKKKLEQDALQEAERRKEEDLKRQLEIQKEYEANQKKAQADFDKVRQANEEKRRLLSEMAMLSSETGAIITQITETGKTIADIRGAYEQAKQTALTAVKDFYATKYRSLDTIKKDPWEKQSEFDDRKKRELAQYRYNEYLETEEINKKYQTVIADNTRSLEDSIRDRFAQTYSLGGASVDVTLGEFDVEREVFPLTITSKNPDVPFNTQYSYSIKSPTSSERRERYNAVMGTYTAGGYVAELAYKIDQTSIRPIVVTVKLLNLLEDGKEELFFYTRDGLALLRQEISSFPADFRGKTEQECKELNTQLAALKSQADANAVSFFNYPTIKKNLDAKIVSFQVEKRMSGFPKDFDGMTQAALAAALAELESIRAEAQLASLALEDYGRLKDRINLTMAVVGFPEVKSGLSVEESAKLLEDLEALKKRADAGNVSFPGYNNKKTTLENTIAESRKIGELKTLEARRANLLKQIKAIEKNILKKSTNGILNLLLGALGAGTAVFSYVSYENAMADYRNASSSTQLSDAKDDLETYEILFYSGVGVGSLFSLTGTLALIDPNNSRGIKAERNRLTPLRKEMTRINLDITRLKTSAGGR